MCIDFSLEDSRIIYQDNHLLVVNKPPGLLTQPDDSAQSSLLEVCRLWVKEKYQKPGNVFLEAVHRLDKPASGIVLFAKTSKALSRLNASIRSKEAIKKYLALVSGDPSQFEGTLVNYLVHGNFKAMIAAQKNPLAKEARLSFKVLKRESHRTFIEVILETGRYHQIRAQFAAIGCPLLGDLKYGGPPFLGEGIALHHAFLELPHPITKEKVVFRSDPPWQ